MVTGVSGGGGTVLENDPLDETATQLLLLLADGSEVEGDDPELELRHGYVAGSLSRCIQDDKRKAKFYCLRSDSSLTLTLFTVFYPPSYVLTICCTTVREVFPMRNVQGATVPIVTTCGAGFNLS